MIYRVCLFGGALENIGLVAGWLGDCDALGTQALRRALDEGLREALVGRVFDVLFVCGMVGSK